MHAHSIVGPSLPSPPTLRVSPLGAAHLTAALTRAFAKAERDGSDPGGWRLRALCPSLEDLAEALRAELVNLEASAPPVAAGRPGDHGLGRILSEIERLAALARGLSAPSADETVPAPPDRTHPSLARLPDEHARD